MADLSLIKIWELNPVSWYDGSTCSLDDAVRDWLPVTELELNGKKRVTVRAPYPLGDYENYELLTNEQKECTTCQGTGEVNGEVCPTCHGVGNCAESGAISMGADGIIRLRIDDTTLGISADGRLFARLKLKENGGLDRDADDAVYVKVDDSTIKINDNGQLCAVTIQPYSESFTQEHADPSAAIPLFTVDDGVEKVKLHIAVDIKSTAYESANELTVFTLSAGGTSAKYCWDKTVPYTMINFDTIVDVSSNKNVVMTLDPEPGDNFNNSDLTVTANVISC